jgi:hypothetical protein
MVLMRRRQYEMDNDRPAVFKNKNADISIALAGIANKIERTFNA